MWSLVTLTGLVAVTLTAAMWFYVAVTPRIDPGFRRWAVGCALITAGLGCLLTAGRWPQLISVVATNVFTVLGGIEFARGVRAFFGVSPMTVFYRSMLAAFVAYTLVFTYLVPRLDLRLIGASVVFAAAFLDCAWVTWPARRASCGAPAGSSRPCPSPWPPRSSPEPRSRSASGPSRTTCRWATRRARCIWSRWSSPSCS